MTGDVELTKSTTTESLHYRNSGGRIYETRTPDGEPAHPHGSAAATATTAAKDEQSTLFNWEEAEDDGRRLDKNIKGKGRAMTSMELDDRIGGNGGGHSPASSDGASSDEDDELLPSFGGQDDFDRPVSSASYAHKNTLNSSSRASLGMSQNGFISRDDVLEGDYVDNGDRNGNDNNDDSEKPYKENNKPKKKRRKAKDRHNPGRFAREMAFVTVPSILLSMLGSVLAGEVLAEMKHWPVFLRVEELFILVPILLNLKGNLEMNLAARFSTSANIGELDLRQTRRSLILGNMALLQVQALLVSLLAGIVAFILGLMSRTGLADSPATLTGHDISIYGIERGGYFECLMVLCASMIAASASSAVVGAFMCSLVVVSRYLRINPDNLATPLAASLGDLLALTILGVVAKVGAGFVGTLWSTVIFLGLVVFIGMNVFFTLRNAYVQELIWAGWIPLLLALAVSSATGVVLQTYVNQYRGFGLLAPVVTGVAGNVGAIFVSRISTALHGAKEEKYLLTGSTLFAITTPILIAFLAFVWGTGQAKIGLAFTFTYSFMSLILMVATLYCAYRLTFWLWSRDFDPDINALPLLSSAVDLLGQLLLVGAYALAAAMGGDVVLPPPVITASGEVVLNGTAIADGLANGALKEGATRLMAFF